jgi:hypothetical protein
MHVDEGRPVVNLPRVRKIQNAKKETDISRKKKIPRPENIFVIFV